MTPQPTIGRIVHYTCSEQDAVEINRRRADARASGFAGTNSGAIVHVGNPVRAGDSYPMIVTKVWSEGHVNGQVFLDGNDLFWATSIPEGEGERTYRWP